MANFTFADLRVHYGTGRSYTVSGEGRNRVLGYRVGKMCNAGDIEVSDWCQMVREVIRRFGEQELQAQLLSFLKDRNYTKAPKTALEEEALELHAARIFDNPEWVYFVDFNEQYRPDVLAAADLVVVLPECCKQPGRIPRVMLEKSKLHDGQNYCPHCKRWTYIRVAQEAA